MLENFPPVEGGGSLILAWQIRNKRVLVVGGGEVSPMRLPCLTKHWQRQLIVNPGSCRSHPECPERRRQSDRCFSS